MEYTGPVSELKEMCEIRIEVAGTCHKSDLAREWEHQLRMACTKKISIYGYFCVCTIVRYCKFHCQLTFSGLKITAALSPVKMTGQTNFSSDITRFWPVKFQTLIVIYF